MAALLLGVPCSCVFTSERRPQVDVKVEAASAFVFRGQVMTDRPVLQPETAVLLPHADGSGTRLRAWGNLDLTDHTGDAWFDPGHAGEFTQIDLSVAHARSFGPVDVTAGLTHYTWANGESFPFRPFESTAEVFASCAGEVTGLRPMLTVHYDIDEVESLYIRAEVAREFALAEALRLLVRGGIAWSDDDHSQWLYSRPVDAWSDADLRATLLWSADDVTTVYGGVHASTIVDDTLRDWFRPRIDPDNVWFHAGVAWAF